MESVGGVASVAPSETRSIEDGPYCPECGRLLNEAVPDRRQQVRSHRWWPELLAAVGMYVVVVFGLRAWHASTDVASNQAALRTLAEATAMAPMDQLSSGWLAAAEASLAARRPFDLVAAAAERELARSRTAVVLGLAALSLGLSALARDRVFQARGPNPARGAGRHQQPDRHPLIETMRGLWALGESLGAASFFLLLVVLGAVAIAQAIRGVPPTPELFDRVTDRTLDIVAAVVELLW